MVVSPVETTKNDAAPCCGGDENRAAGEPCCTPDVSRDDETKRAQDRAVKQSVRAYYAERAVSSSSCCGPGCGCASEDDFDRIGMAVGYSEDDLRAAPEGANLGLGCGNPTAIDEIPAGATVLDLGSGAGMDSFLAARKVGRSGKVIGIDMTPEMIALARDNATRVGLDNVEFRLGEIEELPVEDASVDVIISNCVINLSPDKERVFSEAFRVLRPGGRLMVSDLVLSRTLPDAIRNSAAAYAGCIAGAELKYRYLAQIQEAGFREIRVTGEDDYLTAVDGDSALDWAPETSREEVAAFLKGDAPVVSLKVSARKPY